MTADLLCYVLRLADDQLIAGHRLSEWTRKGPTLEEDLALSNMALDLLGQGQAMYQYAAELCDDGRTEDDLAYLRTDREYTNLLMLEMPNGDFAQTILRHSYYATFMQLLWARLAASSNLRLAAIANKSVKESRYHVRHCAQWVIRLGNGTEESIARLQAAKAILEPYLGEMFAEDHINHALPDITPLPASLKQPWLQEFTPIAQQAGLSLPTLDLRQRGGREGLHTEDLGYLLAEMQYLQRAYPRAQW